MNNGALSYIQNIKDSVRTLTEGLKLTLGHFLDARQSRKPIGVEDPAYFEQDKGIVTLQYPHESIPVPDTGRYRLHNEIDDCIVCDKCAKICPVDCIEIEPVKAVETYGVTSDGTPKRIHAARFDIDMGKCCFCGLCTTVCPTECLTMTKVYDFPEFDIKDHRYSFSEMSLAEIAQKRQELEAHEAQKQAGKEAAQAVSGEKTAAKPAIGKPKVAGAKPVMKKPAVPKPVVPKPVVSKAGESKEEPPKPEPASGEGKPKPKFRPKPMIPRKPKNED